MKSTFPHLDALVLSHFQVLVLPLKLVLVIVRFLHQPIGQGCLRLYLGSSFCLPNCPLSLCANLLRSYPSSGPSNSTTSSRKSPWVAAVLLTFFRLLPLLAALSRQRVLEADGSSVRPAGHIGGAREPPGMCSVRPREDECILILSGAFL